MIGSVYATTTDSFSSDGVYNIKASPAPTTALKAPTNYKNNWASQTVIEIITGKKDDKEESDVVWRDSGCCGDTTESNCCVCCKKACIMEEIGISCNKGRGEYMLYGCCWGAFGLQLFVVGLFMSPLIEFPDWMEMTPKNIPAICKGTTCSCEGDYTWREGQTNRQAAGGEHVCELTEENKAENYAYIVFFCCGAFCCCCVIKYTWDLNYDLTKDAEDLTNRIEKEKEKYFTNEDQLKQGLEESRKEIVYFNLKLKDANAASLLQVLESKNKKPNGMSNLETSWDCCEAVCAGPCDFTFGSCVQRSGVECCCCPKPDPAMQINPDDTDQLKARGTRIADDKDKKWWDCCKYCPDPQDQQALETKPTDGTSTTNQQDGVNCCCDAVCACPCDFTFGSCVKRCGVECCCCPKPDPATQINPDGTSTTNQPDGVNPPP